jgi:Tol biopolymer transport system component
MLGVEQPVMQRPSTASLPLGLALLFGFALGERAEAQYTQRVSVSSAGVQGNSYSYSPSLSADGRFVAFTSRSPNLVGGDANGHPDIFVRDRQGGTTVLASLSTSGVQANDDCGNPSISADGRYVAFESAATTLVFPDQNGAIDVFVRDLTSRTTTRESDSYTGFESNSDCLSPSISADGRYVVFWSTATNLVPGDTNGCADVFVRDRQSRTTIRASVGPAGEQGDGDSLNGVISADGRFVAFESYATNLVPGDTNSTVDVFVRDLAAGVTTRVSVDSSGAQANGDSNAASISADGRHVAFLSLAANLVPGDTNGNIDVFVRDLLRGVTRRASVDSSGAQANDFSIYPRISGDGRCVVFVSFATNLVSNDTNGPVQADLFLRDTLLGTTTRMNVGPGGVQDDGSAESCAISADARIVAYDSTGSDLVPNDTNGVSDVFVRDRFSGTSFTSTCEPGIGGTVTCPCGNPPDGARRGCDNSSGTGGASLSASGGSFLSEDTLVLSALGLRPNAACAVLQGDAFLSGGHAYGQGVRCIVGTTKRMYPRFAQSGVTSMPDFAAGDPSISARSAALGVPITPGTSRWYEVVYRDAIVLGGCPGTAKWNLTQTGQIAWQP